MKCAHSLTPALGEAVTPLALLMKVVFEDLITDMGVCCGLYKSQLPVNHKAKIDIKDVFALSNAS